MELDDLRRGEFFLVQFEKNYPENLLRWLFECVCHGTTEQSKNAFRMWEIMLKGDSCSQFILGENYNTNCIYNKSQNSLELEWIPRIADFEEILKKWDISPNKNISPKNDNEIFLIDQDDIKEDEYNKEEILEEDDDDKPNCELEKYVNTGYPYPNLSFFLKLFTLLVEWNKKSFKIDEIKNIIVMCCRMLVAREMVLLTNEIQNLMAIFFFFFFFI